MMGVIVDEVLISPLNETALAATMPPLDPILSHIERITNHVAAVQTAPMDTPYDPSAYDDGIPLVFQNQDTILVKDCDHVDDNISSLDPRDYDSDSDDDESITSQADAFLVNNIEVVF